MGPNPCHLRLLLSFEPAELPASISNPRFLTNHQSAQAEQAISGYRPQVLHRPNRAKAIFANFACSCSAPSSSFIRIAYRQFLVFRTRILNKKGAKLAKVNASSFANIAIFCESFLFGCGLAALRSIRVSSEITQKN
jgi:hypothetical protein